MATRIQVVFDAADPDKLAHFWAEALGYIIQPPPEGYESWQQWLVQMGVPESEWDRASAIVDPDREGPRVFFQKVPEPKSVKNRVHLDVHVSTPDLSVDERKAKVWPEVARLEKLGATQLYTQEEMGGFFVTMADLEGNEFCVH
jgi:Glyoxalase-like domain